MKTEAKKKKNIGIELKSDNRMKPFVKIQTPIKVNIHKYNCKNKCTRKLIKPTDIGKVNKCLKVEIYSI